MASPGGFLQHDQLRSLLQERGFAQFGDMDRDGVYAVDLDGTFVDGNTVFFERTGLTREQLATMSIGSAVQPEYKQLAADSFLAAKNGEVRSWRAVALASDGSSVNTLTITIPFLHEGVCVAVLGIVRDVGELEQTESRAKEVESRLSDILDSMSDGIFFVNRDWILTYANERAEVMSRHPRSELIGSSLWELFPHLVESEIGDTYRRAMSAGERAEFQGFSVGLARWVVITANPTSDGLAVYARDIGDEVEAKTKLHSSESRTLTQAALLDAARDAMIVRNLDGSVAYWNRAAAVLYGWSPDEAVAILSTKLLYVDPTEYDAALTAVFTVGFWAGMVQQRRKDGSVLTVESRWTLVRTPQGEPDSIFDVSSDVTKQLAAEQHEIRAQRVESLGRLAGGIAHDLNNVLTPILLSAQMIADMQETETGRTLAASIERAALRGADLISQVLSFARGDDGHRERIKVDSLLFDLERFCRETLPKNIDVTVTSMGNLPDVLGDSTQLMQVLINVVVNARDAMPDGGRLGITATRENHPDLLVVEVRDSGGGMDEQTLDAIFEPFYTTKALGAGTGLGLATSLSIAERHGGSLTARSEPGVGTTLRLSLPALDEQAEPDVLVETAEEPAVRRGSGQLVLVVDDESPIRAANRHALEAAGYSIVEAEHGADALERFAEHGEQIRLVLTDIMMPVLDGATMARELRARGYRGPVLATSGGIHAGEPMAEIDNSSFLSKPYSARDLVRLVHDLINSADAVERTA